jgi:hypothetical protein
MLSASQALYTHEWVRNNLPALAGLDFRCDNPVAEINFASQEISYHFGNTALPGQNSV